MARQPGKPYHPGEIRKRHIKNAATKANLGEGIGWHTFRHSYRSWLDESGAPMKVQQELMRHASIQTTMNVYGRAMVDSKREANRKVVQMVLEPTFACQDQSVEIEKGPLPAPLVHVN